MKLEYKINKNSNYKTLKEILRYHFHISERLLVKLKKNQKILLNNTPSYIDKNIENGDLITVDLDFDEESDNIVPNNINLNIIYEDEALLIINKEPNMPVHPSMSHYTNSLSNGIKYYFEQIGLHRKIRPVNRLDKDTSGIVIFAKNEYIQESLIKQMKSNIFKKEYIAILEGFIETNTGKINYPIARKKDSIIERETNLNGDNAITHYELIKTFTFEQQNLSLIKFILETGRTHQIRVHSKFIGHPILGDTLYGNPSTLINRQALHAYKVSFVHPLTNNIINLEIELPQDMKKITI